MVIRECCVGGELPRWWPSGKGRLLLGCLTSQQHATYLRGGSAENITCCHTELEISDQTFHLTQSLYTDSRPTSPNTDLLTPGTW